MKKLIENLVNSMGFLAVLVLASATLVHPVNVRADDQPSPRSYVPPADMALAVSQLRVRKNYALGLGRFDVDAHTEIIGWRLSNAVYFGRQDGLDSGLTLVWQQQANQVSLSKDGVRLTRRF